MTDIPDLIARVRELDKAATKGPWRVGRAETFHVFCPSTHADAMGPERVLLRMNEHFPHETDAALIAYYRDAAPALADECQRLRGELAVWRDGVGRRCCDHTRSVNEALRVDKGVLTAERDAAKAECERLRERGRVLEEALRMCADALDELMGDTDLDDDTSKAFVAHRAARAALAKGGE